jgi:NAD(P)H dehydrogenase (quinone)
MPKVLVLFYSRTGATAALADAVAEGAGSVKFTEVEVRRIEDLTPQSVIDADERWRTAHASLAKKYRTLESVESIAQYDALIIGGPARYGILCAELKNVLDQVGPLWERGALVEKVGSAFGTTAAPSGGHEMNIISMLIPMMQLGMILVPQGCSDPSVRAAGTPYGASGSTGDGAPGEGDLAIARHQGARVAKVAEWLRHAKSHEGHKH